MSGATAWSELEVTIELGLDEPDDASAIRARVGALLGQPAASLPPLEVKKRSIDARRGRVRFHLLVGAADPSPPPLADPPLRPVAGRPVIIVGAGPAGLFCAYQLARAGVPAIVLDRGKPVQARRRDLKGLTQHGQVDPDSNYCFGEGGAGTYSDGKLYTRAHKRGDIRDVLEILVAHGAPAEILVDARPHIGSNRLPKVITGLREHLEQVGSQVRFGARVTGLRVDGGRVHGVRLAAGEDLDASEVVLATGHSARDVYTLAVAAGVVALPKEFALGVRVEHPQAMVDRAQYGGAGAPRHPRLPAAAYRLAHTPAPGRGVFSFCMCPGGWIVPAATEADGVVVNGMSLSRRDSPFANSGLVLSVGLGDLDLARDPFAGITLQRRLEQAAAVAGGGHLRAPATRVADFLAGRGSTTTPPSSYEPGLTAVDLAEVLGASGLPLAQRLRDALRVFAGQLRGFDAADGVLVGVESRTSSPLRLPRDPALLTAHGVAGLYPTGEGAGYAGGIVSAALDGIRVARAILAAR
ncbi:MAG: NAD(P)/FAD-dependent oxidoreductase [Kofleriaceae bacterium]|nr:NAD(P)/FAD-dependent oxidoreductase [Kofleriaceae bacterium]